MTKKFQLTKRDVVILIVLLALVIGITYVHTNSPLIFSRLAIHIQKPIVQSKIRCSGNAPEFLRQLTHYTIKSQDSLNNQLVFIDEKGDLSHCESGWEDGFYGTQPVTVNSRFAYASVGKVVTSAMVLRLVNDGKISLDDKMVDILQIHDLQDERIAQIDVAMLLEHRAGFDRFKTVTPMLTAGEKPWCPTQLSHLSELRLDFDPDTQFQYSNVGYCLLGAIIEKVEGKPFAVVAQEMYQLDKRGIKFITGDMVEQEIAYDYRFEDFYGSNWRSNFDFADSLMAVAGLTGSAKEMALLMQQMKAEQPLNILSRSTNPCVINVVDGCYGYALKPYQETGSDYTLYNKDGHFPGVETDVFIDDKGGILAIYRGTSLTDSSELAEFRQHIYQVMKSINEP